MTSRQSRVTGFFPVYNNNRFVGWMPQYELVKVCVPTWDGKWIEAEKFNEDWNLAKSPEEQAEEDNLLVANKKMFELPTIKYMKDKASNIMNTVIQKVQRTVIEPSENNEESTSDFNSHTQDSMYQIDK
jgi:hypothetical protein